MKYLKTYESLTEYNIGDYILKKQFQGLNKNLGYAKIIAIIELRDKQHLYRGYAYKIIFANQHTLDIDKNLIIRKLTDDEIQQYENDTEECELNKNIDKYNL